MKRESFVFAVSGVFFGLLVGWILGSQSQIVAPPALAPPPAAAQNPAAGQPPPPPPLDLARVADLERRANANPGDAAVRIDLANLYFDGQRHELAIPWYEAALALVPGDVNVSTDLAVSFYYTGQTDRALAQIDRSLAMDPGHIKTLFNQGIIRAGGQLDLVAAAESFRRVVALAPTSPEGLSAKGLLDGIAQHAATGGSGPVAPGSGSTGGGVSPGG
jgi:tetratricopeptide (TPR) repeat protein